MCSIRCPLDKWLVLLRSSSADSQGLGRVEQLPQDLNQVSHAERAREPRRRCSANRHDCQEARACSRAGFLQRPPLPPRHSDLQLVCNMSTCKTPSSGTGPLPHTIALVISMAVSFHHPYSWGTPLRVGIFLPGSALPLFNSSHFHLCLGSSSCLKPQLDNLSRA